MLVSTSVQITIEVILRIKQTMNSVITAKILFGKDSLMLGLPISLHVLIPRDHVVFVWNFENKVHVFTF